MSQIKILFVVTSTLMPDCSKPLSYTNSRSIFSSEDRLKQTLATIESIQLYAKGADILVCDNSKAIPLGYKLSIEKTGSKLIERYEADADSAHKSLGESQNTLAALQFLQESKQDYDLYFKISGRYQLDKNFKVNNYSIKGFTFWQSKQKDMVRTLLYSVGKSSFGNWMKAVQTINQSRSVLGYEVLMNSTIQKDVTYIPCLGVGGYVSVDGTWFSG